MWGWYKRVLFPEIYNRTAREGEANHNPDTHRSASMLQTKVQGQAQKVRKDEFTRDSVETRQVLSGDPPNA